MRIAVFTKNRLNPAYEGARIGADRAAARFGATTEHYVPETPDDPEQQTALIEEALSQRPDAFVLVPAHPTRVNEAIRAINDSGIPLVALVNRPTQGRCVSFVGADDYQLAGQVARNVYDRLAGTANGPQLQVWQRPIPLVLAGLALIVASSLAVWTLTRPDVIPADLMRFVIAPPDTAPLSSAGNRPDLAISLWHLKLLE